MHTLKINKTENALKFSGGFFFSDLAYAKQEVQRHMIPGEVLLLDFSQIKAFNSSLVVFVYFLFEQLHLGDRIKFLGMPLGTIKLAKLYGLDLLFERL